MTGFLTARGGAVYAEFLLAFTPFFLLFLGGLQLAFLAGARVVVQHAAARAVRTAVVTLDDDPVFYDGGERKRLDPRGEHVPAPALVERLAKLESPGGRKRRARGDGRFARIRSAAYVPLSVLAPAPEQLDGLAFGSSVHPSRAETSLSDALGKSPLARIASGFFAYARAAAAITFPVAPGSTGIRQLARTTFADDEPVTVRVTFLYFCGVPIVRAWICDPAAELADRGASRELAHAEQPLSLELLGPGQTFAVLSAEATLPNHGAAYRYASELCKTERRLATCRGVR